MVAWTPRNILVVAVLVSAVVAGIVGLGVTYALHPTPAAHTRDFYMFAVDQGFPAANTTGLKADYAFSAMTITVNKGDTLIIHFYNPTDQSHTFTIGSPYTNNVILPAMTSTHISTANVTTVANQAGTFAYTCNFHGPSMAGYLIVQG
ncbi:MAG TPA: cupredoxin domain-containing protein [Candidatus Angelobacter sp.]|nr:cupredoxin domain-containing protein [Candidatus Angelobacter sp.]